MKKLVLLTAAAMLAAFYVPGANAVPIKGHGPGEVQSDCGKGGGMYFPPGVNGMYGCLTKNGGGVLCGGAGGYSKTCTVMQPSGKRTSLPRSQEELSTQTKTAAHAK